MTTWVLLRGLAREARHWGGFPEKLRAALELPADAIVTPDLPGNGTRFRERSPTDVVELMEAVRTDLRARGHAPPYHLLALSLGGMVAVAWASRYPEECRALVLINTSLRPYSPFYQRLRPRAWPTLPSLLFASGMARERAILKLTSARAEELAGVLPQWAAWARECPVSPANATRQLLAAARYAAPRRPQVPMLVLGGDGDGMVNPECSRELARAWNADLAIHPNAGHDMLLDAPDWVARELRRWLG
jgi:pimeloyl-ACP methyl ester carboxylesterase